MKTRKSSSSGSKGAEDPQGQDVNRPLDGCSTKRSGSKLQEASQPTSGGVRSTRRRLLKPGNCEENIISVTSNDNFCRQTTNPAETSAGCPPEKFKNHSNGQGQDFDQSFSEEKRLSSDHNTIFENVYHKNKTKEDILEDDGVDWEVGEHLENNTDAANEGDWNRKVSITLEDTQGVKNKSQQGRNWLRRATAKDKEFAELVHKAHLLCLLARGRAVDASCEDPLLQGSLVSMLPSSLSDIHKYSTEALSPIVAWFQNTFNITFGGGPTSISNIVPLSTRLLQVLEKQACVEEEVAALSVALFRALGFVTRYIMVVDVASLKPDAMSLEASIDWDPDNGNGAGEYLPSADGWSSKNASLGQILARCASSWLTPNQGKISFHRKFDQTISFEQQFQESVVGEGSSQGKQGRRQLRAKGKSSATQAFDEVANKLPIKESQATSPGPARGVVTKRQSNDACTSNLSLTEPASSTDAKWNGSSRKGDQEFELQLAMAMAATAAALESRSMDMGTESKVSNQNRVLSDASSHPLVGSDQFDSKMSSENVFKHRNTKEEQATGLVWSRNRGPILHWAEVLCGGEGPSERWIPVDTARGIVDGARLVESAASICKFPLHYIFAFAGGGVKDVTRRYVTLWSKAVPLRVDQVWLDATLHPLRQLEAAATNLSSVNPSDPRAVASEGLERKFPKGQNLEGSSDKDAEHRSMQCKTGALEDMELEIKALNEPLPTNQQAYKNHHLYALERWLTKYQILHPKGPVLGYCAGQPVYPRTCIQNLHTADRWLREGFKVKSGETPVKVVKASRLAVSDTNLNESEVGESSPNSTMTQLFGKWQTEVWHPPPAVDGIVPKNERGHVDVWSEKCLSPGTVHLRLPHLVPVARRLGIDFAPAMVGFEVRNRRSLPVFDGIVVCEEFRAAILEAYAEEEERRNAETQKKRADQAAARWLQLFRSMVTRQRLRATYEDSTENKKESVDVSVVETIGTSKSESCTVEKNSNYTKTGDRRISSKAAQNCTGSHHTHLFPEETQTFDEESGIRTKRCSCGFTVQVEEM